MKKMEDTPGEAQNKICAFLLEVEMQAENTMKNGPCHSFVMYTE